LRAASPDLAFSVLQIARQDFLEIREVAGDHADVKAGENLLLRFSIEQKAEGGIDQLLRCMPRRKPLRILARHCHTMARFAVALPQDNVEFEWVAGTDLFDVNHVRRFRLRRLAPSFMPLAFLTPDLIFTQPESAVSSKDKPVAIIMGSQSDWKTMRRAAETLEALGIDYEALIVSAHRTPDRLVTFAKGAAEAGFKVIIAGAGGAAHLPGMTASMTTLPVFGVPIETKTLFGQDSLLSIVQMPAGVPVGTLAIGEAGAVNAALLAGAVLALNDKALAKRLEAWRAEQTQSVAEHPAKKD